MPDLWQQHPTRNPHCTTLHCTSAGNICRSPTAEAMFRSVVEAAGLADRFDIDSCGTGWRVVGRLPVAVQMAGCTQQRLNKARGRQGCFSPRSAQVVVQKTTCGGATAPARVACCFTGGGASNWYKPGGFSYHEGDDADERITAAGACGGRTSHSRVCSSESSCPVAADLAHTPVLSCTAPFPPLLAAVKRGVKLTSKSRPLQPQDLTRFDVRVCVCGCWGGSRVVCVRVFVCGVCVCVCVGCVCVGGEAALCDHPPAAV
jgi:hypothetical protein